MAAGRLHAAAQRRPRLVVFIVALVVIGGFIALAPSKVRPGPSTDYQDYYRPVAEHLINGQGFTRPDGQPAVYYGPAYPLVLVPAFRVADAVGVGHDAAANGVVALCLAAAALLLFELTRRVFGDRAGWIATGAWLTYPITLTMAARPYSEGPFTALLLAGVLLLVVQLRAARPRLALLALAGAIAGVATLVRPAAIALVVPLAGAAWLWRSGTPVRRRAAFAALVIVGNVAVLAPWEAWAYSHVHEVIPISRGGPHATMAGLAPGFDEANGPRRVALPRDLDAALARVTAEDARRPFTSLGEIARFVWRDTRGHRIVLAQLVAYKLARSWFGTDSLRLEGPVLLTQLLYVSVAVVGAVIAFRSGGDRRRMVWFAAAVIGLFWMVTISVLAIVRYMAPSLTLLFPFIGVAVAAVLQRRRGAPVGAPSPG